jgi:hypothetical protein
VNDGDNTDADLYGEEQLIEEALVCVKFFSNDFYSYIIIGLTTAWY